MHNENLYALFAMRFPADRGRCCIETPQGQRWSYADLEAHAARLARLLVSLGVHKGDRVVAQVDKSPMAFFLYLACLRTGAIYIPLNTAYREEELAYFLADAEPRVVICRPADVQAVEMLAERSRVAHVQTLGADGCGTLTETAALHESRFETVACEPNDVAAILYTSGTTGRPKGAMLTHGNLASNAQTLHTSWGWGPHDVLLHALPIFHVHGLFVASHCVLLNGTKMLFLPRFEPRAVMESLPHATVLMGVPTFYTRLLAEPDFGPETCRNMRLFISGSAPLRRQTFEEFRQRSGHTILERYGMSETGMNTSNPLDGERRPGTVGYALPGVGVRVVDELGAPVPVGAVGEIQLKGPNVFKGYWRLPEKTAEEFTEDGWFRSGDLATRDPDGYITVVGRAKDLVITGGYNVYPKEVEGYLDRIDGVAESAVIGVPDVDLGERVVAVVVRERGDAGPSEPDLIAFLKETMAGYKVPKAVFFTDELPRNAMGKVQKNALREAYG